MASKNLSFLSISIRMLTLICLLSPLSSGSNQQSPNKVRKLLGIALNELVVEGVSVDNLFATNQVKVKGSDLTIYSLGQCMMDVSPADCYECLSRAADYLVSEQYKSGRGRNSVPVGEYHAEGLSLYRSCSMTYQLSPFFRRITPPEAEIRKGKSSSLPYYMISLGGLVVVVLVALAYYYFVRPNIDMTIASRRQEENGGDHEMKFDTERLQFDLARIQTATNMFSEDNKLGEGGFGAVFKGTLGNGQDIAVKRLSKSSGQGAQEFKNEVVLVAKLQHRNLVRLLGFSLEGEETMLVYEYVLNKSLDYFLFDLKKREQLDWPRRCRIIAGIARGILYLHEDSRLRVIHRDLKASNILLDGDMNPKISDFGLAKMLGVDDQTCGTTRRIVGTYGYMAPEYAMQGSYSTKSDVFSFGVLLLEIVTGRRNFLGFHLTDFASTLVVYAWQLWNEGKGLELMDLLLKDSCSPDEFLRCIHIGLLCVQEDSTKRPTMSSVVVMLTTETIPLAILPDQPGFFAGSSATSHRHKLRAHSCSPNGMTISDFMPR